MKNPTRVATWTYPYVENQVSKLPPGWFRNWKPGYVAFSPPRGLRPALRERARTGGWVTRSVGFVQMRCYCLSREYNTQQLMMVN